VPDGLGLVIAVHIKSKKESLSKQLVSELIEAEEEALGKFALRW
jgi:hypothetical protein